ncbi:MAG: SPFH domain-containing protein [Bacteroidota bacterium]
MAIIDFVNWSPDSNYNYYAYKFPETNLSTYTQLVVQESQEAVLFSKGQIIGKFGPGKHTLNTENLPLLRSLYGLPFGGKNPFMAEVWFVNKIEHYNLPWAIDKMDTHDPDYNTNIPLTASGTYGLKLIDAERFLVKIVGTKTSYSQQDLRQQFASEFFTKTKSGLMQFMLANRIGLKQISAFLDQLSANMQASMAAFWENIGFELAKFYVTGVEVDDKTEAGRRILDAISRQSAQAIGGYTWQQSQAFEIAKDATSDLSQGKGGPGGGLLGALVAGNMMNNMGSGMLQPQYGQPAFGPGQAPSAGNVQPVHPIRDVYCSNCSKKFSNSLNFCPHCGDPYCPCPKCGTDNDQGAKRCVSCGTQLAGDNCPNCNTTLAPGVSFCGSCGHNTKEGGCTRCGNVLKPGIKFCPNCGQKA